MSISIIGADTKSLGDHATQDGVEGQIVAFSKQMNWYDMATDSDLKKNYTHFNYQAIIRLLWVYVFLKCSWILSYLNTFCNSFELDM